MYHVNEIFWVAVNVIMNGSYFPSSRKCIISAAIGNLAASNAFFLPHRKDPLVTTVCLSVCSLDLTKMSLRLSVRRKATRGVVWKTLLHPGEDERIVKCLCMILDIERSIYLFISAESIQRIFWTCPSSCEIENENQIISTCSLHALQAYKHWSAGSNSAMETSRGRGRRCVSSSDSGHASRAVLMLIFTSFEVRARAKRNFRNLNSTPVIVAKPITNTPLMKGTVPKRLGTRWFWHFH